MITTPRVNYEGRPKMAYLVFIAGENNRPFKRLDAHQFFGQLWRVRQTWLERRENIF